MVDVGLQGRGSFGHSTHRWAWVWLLLAVGFTGVAAREIYRAFYQEVFGELLRSKITVLADGMPLAVLCLSIFLLQRRTLLGELAVRVMVSATVGLGFWFLGVGIFVIFDSWPEPEKSLQLGSLILIALGFVGYPLGVALVSHRYWSQRATIVGLMAMSWPFLVSISLHILEFLVWFIWPLGSVSLYGAASLALLFAATNFSLLNHSIDLRP